MQSAAAEMAKLFVEAIVAPEFSAEALQIFAAKKNLRLVKIVAARPQIALKQVSGGYLLQDADNLKINAADLKTVTKRAPTQQETDALLFAWTVCKHVKSNAIVYARLRDGFGQTVGVGAGPDEPGRCCAIRRAESRAAVGGDCCRLRCVLPVC